MLTPLLDLLFPPRESERLVRSLGNDKLAGLFRPQTELLNGVEVTTLLPYDEPVVRACVVEAKYHANEHSAKMLGDALVSYLREELADDSLYESRSYVMVPVPLSRTRLRERGYNQAEIIAQHAIAELSEIVLDTNLIIRVRDTLPQTTLDGRARIQNVRGAFGAARMADPDVTYMLIDDVVTTGATMNEAVRVLQKAGAQNIRAIALAH